MEPVSPGLVEWGAAELALPGQAENGDRHIPPFPVEPLDTTGAGDVFHGAFIYGLLQKWNLEDVIRFSHAVAAIKCTQIGARRGIPTLSEVQEFLRNGIC